MAQWVLLAAVMVLWPLLQYLDLFGNVYARLTCVALPALAVWAATQHSHEGETPHRLTVFRQIALGLAVGTVLILATRMAFPPIERHVEMISEGVHALYRSKGLTVPVIEVWALLLIVLAEEVLWRDLAPSLFERFMSRRGAVALSVLAYAAAQVGTGEAVVVVTALLLGAVWAGLREYTSGILSSFISHAMWTLTTLLFPLV